MRDRSRRRRSNAVNAAVKWNTFFWCTLFIVSSSIVFITLVFSPFHAEQSLFKWEATPLTNSRDAITIRDIVILPDQALIYLNYPPSFRFYAEHELSCLYFSADHEDGDSYGRPLSHPPIRLHLSRFGEQIVRCPLPPRGSNVSLLVKSSSNVVQKQDALLTSTHEWTPLVYEAMFDRDNTTIVFVKGLNLRPEKLTEPSRFQCIYGWDFTKPKFLIKSEVVCAAQEIIRCNTPKSILTGLAQAKSQAHTHSIKVTIESKEFGVFPSIARPGLRQTHTTTKRKAHEMCICTMLRNQARFLREWVMYHAKIGVQRWFIYDNNSDDDIEDAISFLQSFGYNVSQHLWPWVKTQEAGFAHCALRARVSCEWVGFIDVDEFFNLRIKSDLHGMISHLTKPGHNIGEIRVPCFSFGPSGLREVPKEGVTVGYTCRLSARERHKSILKPEALNQSLINVVHHFHLSEKFETVDAENSEMVINHYKYQVWKVFKKKFYRRVATYVADWKEKQNVGSRDRAPGLGTKAVEPADWANRFCEVRDNALKNWVLRNLLDRRTHLLPWQPEFEHHLRKRRRRKGKKPLMIPPLFSI